MIYILYKQKSFVNKINIYGSVIEYYNIYNQFEITTLIIVVLLTKSYKKHTHTNILCKLYI